MASSLSCGDVLDESTTMFSTELGVRSFTGAPECGIPLCVAAVGESSLLSVIRSFGVPRKARETRDLATSTLTLQYQVHDNVPRP